MAKRKPKCPGQLVYELVAQQTSGEDRPKWKDIGKQAQSGWKRIASALARKMAAFEQWKHDQDEWGT